MTNHELGRPAFFETTGLQFQCRRCSGCCRFSPGFVFLSHEDVAGLLEATGAALPDLYRSCLRVVRIGCFSRLSLREKPNYDCIFWGNGGCLVYEHRPLQCRSFPFWSSVLSSRESWEKQKKTCPGIDEGGHHSPREIKEWLRKRMTERLIEIDADDPMNLEGEHRLFRERRRPG